jgi:Flp pilus assembly protein CpaB
VVGKLAQVPVYPGQPVVSQMLIARSVLTATHSNASLILEPGTLAVAIPVNTNSNVAEAVQPGDHVDLFANFDINVKELGIPPPTSAITEVETIKVTHLLLQDVVVLEVGTWPRPGPAPVERPVSQVAPTGPLGSPAQAASAPAAQPSNPAPIVVTLQVKAQDASVLKYMEQNAASFSLALRPANDHGLAQPTPVTIDYLMKRFGFSLPDMGR